MELAYIPSPSRGVLHLGPIPLRGYAFCIIIGVFVAVWLGNKRWIARGGRAGTVADIAVWAVPFGLVGGRLYHVITDYELYFSEGRDWVDAFKVWEGGLGIWGAIALGAVGAWIGCRRRGIPLPAWADALAPGIALAQAIGRWGNWFNQELYGKATDLPWAVKITSSTDGRVPGTYQPTFLYESLWCVGVAFLVIWA
ncbi:prolipoprotein diacylglyceryl transferase family protein, partial [Streptomyces sp. NPDC001002]